MSTRAIIRIKGFPHAIYNHSDGYPDGVLPWLKPTVDRFTMVRGKDPEYLLAFILRVGARRYDAAFDKACAKVSDFRPPDRGMLGFGIVSPRGNYGQEYVYTIDASTGEIDVFNVHEKTHTKA